MRKIIMRVVIAVAAIATMTLAEVKSGETAPYTPNPWCLKASMGRSWVVDMCYYRTWVRCNQERYNYGPTSICIVNPEYYFRYGEPPADPPQKVRRSM